MGEHEKGVGTDPHASDAADYVGWLVRLDITDSRPRRKDTSAAIDEDTETSGLTDELLVIEADFRQLTVPLLGRSQRVLPCRELFRIAKVRQRWERLLSEKLGDTSRFKVCFCLEEKKSDTDLKQERDTDPVDEGMKSGLRISVEGGAVSSKVLLGRFHPDHREPNIFDGIEETRRLFEESRRKENKGKG